MREFFKVPGGFWSNTGKTLRRRGGIAAQGLAMYLMTSHTNSIGYFYLPVVFMAHETGLAVINLPDGAETIAELEMLIECGFCSYDYDAEVVWVHDVAEKQYGDLKPKDNRCGYILAEYKNVPKNNLDSAFRKRYGSLLYLPQDDDRKEVSADMLHENGEKTTSGKTEKFSADHRKVQRSDQKTAEKKVLSMDDTLTKGVQTIKFEENKKISPMDHPLAKGSSPFKLPPLEAIDVEVDVEADVEVDIKNTSSPEPGSNFARQPDPENESARQKISATGENPQHEKNSSSGDLSWSDFRELLKNDPTIKPKIISRLQDWRAEPELTDAQKIITQSETGLDRPENCEILFASAPVVQAKTTGAGTAGWSKNASNASEVHLCSSGIRNSHGKPSGTGIQDAGATGLPEKTRDECVMAMVLPEGAGDECVMAKGVPEGTRDGYVTAMGMPEGAGDECVMAKGVPEGTRDGYVTAMGMPEGAGDECVMAKGLPEGTRDGYVTAMGMPEGTGDGYVMAMGLPEIRDLHGVKAVLQAGKLSAEKAAGRERRVAPVPPPKPQRQDWQILTDGTPEEVAQMTAWREWSAKNHSDRQSVQGSVTDYSQWPESGQWPENEPSLDCCDENPRMNDRVVCNPSAGNSVDDALPAGVREAVPATVRRQPVFSLVPPNAVNDGENPASVNHKRKSASDSVRQIYGDVVAELILASKEKFPLYQSDIDYYSNSYPGINVRKEFLAIQAWCFSNETRRKTKSGAMRFVNNWLVKAQNSVSAGKWNNGPDYRRGREYGHDIMAVSEPDNEIPDGFNG